MEQEFQAEHFLDEACREWIARQEQDDCALRAREACGRGLGAKVRFVVRLTHDCTRWQCAKLRLQDSQ